MSETPEVEYEYDFTEPAIPPEKAVQVAIVVHIDGTQRTFAANATTANDAYFVANGLLSGLDGDACSWLTREGHARRDGN
jgi:hypothetical protein